MTKSKSRNIKRHCMIVHAHYPIGETRVQREAEALIRNGYQVDVLCLRWHGEAATQLHNGVQVIRLPVQYKNHDRVLGKLLEYLRFFLLAAVKLTQLHRRQPYSTVQTHNLPDFLVFCALIPKLSGVPIILDLHDLMPEFYAGRFGKDGGSLLGRLVRWQERLACRFANHVITVSEHWRKTLIDRGVPPQKCSVVMNVADDTIFVRTEDDHPRSPDDSQWRMIYHGSMPERYGLDLAIRAVGLVRSEIPNIHLTLIGGGENVRALRQLIQELDLENNVTQHETIFPVEDLPEIIRAADVGVVPYQNDVFTDTLLPTKLMEYAALGLPAIAARTTAIESCFKDTMVELFEPGDVDDLARCIRMLYNSPERMAQLRAGSAKFNERYNWSKISSEYVALVERLGGR